ncbi:MAG TPA: ATP-binding cassette domain-containing protein, partial [Deltaproteobacteria bacterium]|nr:ATP-binding cassette domain-containing protein [Deltaproteobacteria bacterium]
MIELQGVLKRFGAFTAVDRVDLKIEQGERIVIIGPSGSGKTTLLRMINFLEKIDEGRILIDGHETGYRRDKRGRLVLEKPSVICALRSEIGMVFQ